MIEATLAERFPEVELVDLEVRGGPAGTLDALHRPARRGRPRAVRRRERRRSDDVRERYALEVSSPGLDRRLRKPAHFAEALGPRGRRQDWRSRWTAAATSAASSRRPTRRRSRSPWTTAAASTLPIAGIAKAHVVYNFDRTTEAIVSKEIIEALRQIEKEKGIAFDALVDALEDALLSAYKKTPDAVEHAKVEVDTETGDMRVYELIFPDHIDVEALKVHDEEGEEIGLDLSGVDMSEVERIEVTPDDFGRIAAQTAKQVILQRIREAERDLMYEEYVDRVGELVTGIVQQSDPRHNRWSSSVA